MKMKMYNLKSKNKSLKWLGFFFVVVKQYKPRGQSQNVFAMKQIKCFALKVA